jgi:hypothetical protein
MTVGQNVSSPHDQRAHGLPRDLEGSDEWSADPPAAAVGSEGAPPIGLRVISPRRGLCSGCAGCARRDDQPFQKPRRSHEPVDDQTFVPFVLPACVCVGGD